MRNKGIKKEDKKSEMTDGHRVYHTNWSKSDRERQMSHDITYM